MRKFLFESYTKESHRNGIQVTNYQLFVQTKPCTSDLLIRSVLGDADGPLEEAEIISLWSPEPGLLLITYSE